MRLILEDATIRQYEDYLDDIPFTEVFCIPCVTGRESLHGHFKEFEPDLVPYGSTSLLKTGLELGWRGAYFNENFSYSAALEAGMPMLNKGICKVADLAVAMAQRSDSQLFIRPDRDLKAFPGMVIEQSDARHLVDELLTGSSRIERMEPDDLVVLSEVVPLISEIRFFVFSGEVVEASMYRHKGVLCSISITEKKFWNAAQDLVDQWVPHPNCAIDLALTSKGWRIVEYNCINCAGFYSANPSLIFNALLSSC